MFNFRSYRFYLGSLDITRYVDQESFSIDKNLDDGEIYDFTVSEVSLTVSNENGRFSPNNNQNLFVDSGQDQSGYRAEINIYGDQNLIFSGQIIRFSNREADDNSGATVRWSIVENSVDLIEQNVEDYGIPKRLKIIPRDRNDELGEGTYLFPTAVSPPSDQSASGTGSAFLQQLHFENQIQIEGLLNPRNVTIEDSELKTEGGYLPEGDDPLITFKAPFRYNNVSSLIQSLLEHYGINRNKVTISSLENEESAFQDMGRVGYATEWSETDTQGRLSNLQEGTWEGYVTDFVIDEQGHGYVPRLNCIAEHQNNVYGASREDAGTLYRIYPDTRTIKKVAVIGNEINDRVDGLTSINDRLILMTRRNLYELKIDDDDSVTVIELNLSGYDVDGNGRLGSGRGHGVGLTTRGDQIFIGYRQGLNYATIHGNNVEVHAGFTYRDAFSEIMGRVAANSIEYLNGRFYTVGEFSQPTKVYSFAMENGITPTDLVIHEMQDLRGALLGKYQGNLIGVDGNHDHLVLLDGLTNKRTDLLNPTIYFLYSARQSFTNPKIIRYQLMSDTWEDIFQYPRHGEFWKMATKDFDTFYILGMEDPVTDRPPAVAYNAYYHSPSNPNSNTIWKYNVTANTFEGVVNSSNLYRPQLAQYYHTGFEGSQNRFGFKPDSRKGLHLDLTDLYYIYTNDINFGVAKLDADGNTSAILSARIDNWHNECSCDFTIAEENIYGSFTFVYADPADSANVLSTVHWVSHSLGRRPQFQEFVHTQLQEGTAYDRSVHVVADPVASVVSSVTTGDLPTGLTLDKLRLHGTPTGIPDDGVSFTVTYTATNNRGTATTDITFNVKDENAAAPVLGAFTAVSLTEDVAYDETITATGLPTPRIISRVTTGTLPIGLTLDDARLHGTPTDIPDAGSTFTVTFTASNSEGVSTRAIVFTVAGA